MFAKINNSIKKQPIIVKFNQDIMYVWEGFIYVWEGFILEMYIRIKMYDEREQV
jgi:hypothetical protein